MNQYQNSEDLFVRQTGAPRRHSRFYINENINPEWRMALDKILAMENGFIVALLGSRGTGKTQMSVNVLRKFYKEEKSCWYTKAVDFYLDYRNCFKNDSGETEIEIVRKYSSFDLLVIDALENRSDTQFENMVLNHIIDKRYDNYKNTILISNETDREFSVSTGLSIYSRMCETGGKITCSWKSFRNN
jgi:DNA replication protein DnaC